MNLKYVIFALVYLMPLLLTAQTVEIAEIAEKEPVITTSPTWSIKTNSVYWLLFTPNIEAEYYFKKQFSVNLEGQYTSFTQHNERVRYGLWAVSPEFRYWFDKEGGYLGHHVGVYGSTGQYDYKLRKNDDGAQGDFWSAGLTYGYKIDVNNYFKTNNRMYLEFGLGLGYVYTPYKKYNKVDGKFCEISSSNRNYFGPTKLKVSFVYHFFRK